MNRLASAIARRPRRVALGWLLLVLVMGALGGGLEDRLGNGGLGVPGSESETARQIQERDFEDGRGSRLFVAQTTPRPSPGSLRRAASDATAALRRLSGVAAVDPVLIAPDGRAAIVPFRLDAGFSDAQKEVVDVRDAVEATAPPGGEVEVIGEAAAARRYTDIAREDLARAEALSFPAPMALLLLAFLSVVAAGLPTVAAGAGLLVTFGVLYLISLVVDMSVFATNTAVALGIALSIDFALFIVTRYREVRRSGEAPGPPEAIRAVLDTTGRAILLSGLTVASSLMALLIVGVGLFDSLAIGATVAALAATVTALTLVPAVLLLLGDRVDRWTLRRAAAAAERARFWHWLGDRVVRRPAAVAAASVALLVVLAIPALDMQIAFRSTGELPSSDSVRRQTERVAESFGAGVLAPIDVLTADAPRADRILRANPGVARVLAPERGEDGRVRVRALPRGTADSRATERTVRDVRDATGALGPGTRVGGQTSQNIDLKDRIDERTPWVVAAVLLLAAAILTAGFRSLLVPIKAVATTALAVAAGLGVTTFLFHDVAGHETLGYFVPLLAFAIVFGLSIDYEIFLISRIRERFAATGDNDLAIREGLVRSGRVIGLAGATMAIIFGIFATSSLVAFQELGVAVAVAIVVDMTIIRAALVPATLALVGELNWWLPGRRAAGRRTAAR